MAHWMTSIVCMVAAVGLPAVNVHFLPLLLLLAPLACEALRAMRDRATPTFLCAVLLYECSMYLPHDGRMLLCAAMTVLPVCMIWLPVGEEVRRRGAIWCGVMVVMSMAVMWLLGRVYDGHAVEGLTQEMTRYLGELPQIRVWLYQLINTGVLELDTARAVDVMKQLSGAVPLLPETIPQLLLTIQRIMAQIVTAAIPKGIVFISGITGMLCAVVPDAIQGRVSGWRDIPPVRKWYMDHTWTMPLILLMVPSVLVLVVDAPWLVTFAALCDAAFQLALGVQGVALLLHLRHEKQVGAVRTMLVSIMILLMPMILMWLGAIDQFADFRGLRPIPEDDDNNDDDLF